MDGQSQGTENRYNYKFQSHYKSKNSNIRGINRYYEHYHELSNDYDNLIRMNNELYDNELCCNGGGVLVNNSMHTTDQMYNNKDHVDLPPEMTYLRLICQQVLGVIMYVRLIECS